MAAVGTTDSREEAFEYLRTLIDDQISDCLLYTSDAAAERSSVDLGGRRIIKTKKNKRYVNRKTHTIMTSHIRYT